MFMLKEDVRFASGMMAMGQASIVINEVCKEMHVDCVVTGGTEKHMHPPSLHPLGGALDYRIRDYPHIKRKEMFAKTVAERLGPAFNVLLKPDHLHVEYDPK
ncbi:hypothetical protein LCGC14_1559020 [marine sediment metagenome]|uniref:Peptidase M15A C-terminal domain-containing protein n=1 Tax=marine sediment metagenome TaxID=412755 RepID=A0A0F9IN39_9ZZZZ